MPTNLNISALNVVNGDTDICNDIILYIGIIGKSSEVELTPKERRKKAGTGSALELYVL
jgi:hypothetical protein